MKARAKNETHLLFGYKPCLRTPRQPEATLVVRGKYRLAPGAPLELCRDPRVTQEALSAAAAAGDELVQSLVDTAIHLGQGSLEAERFRDGDDGRVGEPVYPGDFADFKNNAEVMLRGTCHAPRDATECEVAFGVAQWQKRLRVVGHRIRTDRVAGGDASKPKPIGAIAVDYAHAYGGPGFADNPIGKGHLDTERKSDGDLADEDELYQPPRSHRSAVMPAQQLPNVQHASGRDLERGQPAGFGPVNPTWPTRSGKLGKKYDEQWLNERAPYPAADFDPSYHHAAPPDQQLTGYLRGDEEVWFENLHRESRKLKTKLPGLRVRVFVVDRDDDTREAPMQLDTLFADLDEGALYLTWRGQTAAKEEDLTDIEHALVVTEPLAEPPRPIAPYLEALRAHAKDPIGLDDAFPEGFSEFAANGERLMNASDEEIEAMVDDAMSQPDTDPISALAKGIFGPMLGDKLDSAAPHLKSTTSKVEPAKLKQALVSALRGEGGGVGVGLPLKEGAKPRMAIGRFVRDAEKQIARAAASAPNPEAKAKTDAALATLRESPMLREVDPNYQPWSPDDGPPDEPGPHANLAGQDLSGRDLSGMSLIGANLEGAVLHRTNLAGADLTDARLAAAQLTRTNLAGAKLTDADLSMASFDRADATGADFSGCKLDMMRMSKTDCTKACFDKAAGLMSQLSSVLLEGAQARGARLEMAAFDECALAGLDLSGATLDKVRFSKCHGAGLMLDTTTIYNVSFHDCELPRLSAKASLGSQVIFLRCKLQGAAFTSADLPASFFNEVEAEGSDFTRANLAEGRFDRALLNRCSFRGAKLSHANLRKAVLSHVSFAEASLYDAQLVQTAGEACDFSGANLERANFHRSQISRI